MHASFAICRFKASIYIHLVRFKYIVKYLKCKIIGHPQPKIMVKWIPNMCPWKHLKCIILMYVIWCISGGNVNNWLFFFKKNNCLFFPWWMQSKLFPFLLFPLHLRAKHSHLSHSVTVAAIKTIHSENTNHSSTLTANAWAVVSCATPSFMNE